MSSTFFGLRSKRISMQWPCEMHHLYNSTGADHILLKTSTAYAVFFFPLMVYRIPCDG